MSASRDATAQLKTAIVRRLRSEWNTANVDGLNDIPLIIQSRPQPHTPFPFIYIYNTRGSEVFKTKQTASRNDTIRAQIITKTTSNKSGEQIRDGVAAEIIRIMDATTGGYLNLRNQGFKVLIQNASVANSRINDTVRAGTFFETTVNLNITTDFIGLPTDIQPVGTPIFTFAGFNQTPANNQIEFGDAGTITGSTAHENSNGWTLNGDISYTQIPGGDGSLSDNTYTVEAGDSSLGLISGFNWLFTTDTSLDTTTTVRTDFNRIRSLRYGALNSNTIDTASLATLADWTDTNRTFAFGTVNPVGQTIEITASAGDFQYIITDDNNRITELTDRFGNPNINNFTQSTINGYRVYIANRALIYDTDLPITYLIS